MSDPLDDGDLFSFIYNFAQRLLLKDQIAHFELELVVQLCIQAMAIILAHRARRIMFASCADWSENT